MSEILDVDLVAFERGDEAERQAIAHAVLRSLQTGFVYCRHDIPEAAIDDAYEELGEFFSIDHDTKLTAAAPGSRGQRGYTGLLVETAAASEHPDWKEMLNWGTTLPPHHPLRRRFPDLYLDNVFPDDLVPGISGSLLLLHDRLLDLQQRFLRIVAVAIGCDAGFFDRMVDHGATLSRAIHYPPTHEAPGPEHVWAAEHGDINLVTALPRATAPGLQVKTDGGWIDAAPPDGCAIINTGIMLEHLTNGVIPTGIHRVVAAPDDARDRLSVVQFAHPTPWTVLTPVPSCISAEHPQRFSAVLAADRLDEVLWQINLVENARRVG
ncbi:MAG: isopenicillin N synthase family oxygenase [Acidimicrobiales bacterium]|nr:isopenicillin N synthase family oxygenase [Acidimicrobiales bacterium]